MEKTLTKKKISILFFIIITSTLLGIIFLYHLFKDDDYYVKSANEGDITRYEWMEMLCEQTGIIEYQNEVSYFSDVGKNNVYFPYLQSAVEWEILDSTIDFNGENYASGKFIALTAMKTIGEHKFQIYLDTKDTITDETYIKVAIEHGVIEKNQLRKGVSIKECERILEILDTLYFGTFWKDNYSNVTYQDGVVELSSDNILQHNTDYSEIVIADNVKNSLVAGTIIVFEDKNTELKIAKKITEINSDGTLSLGSAELDQVVESLTVSDITELSFANIVNYYALEENYNTLNISRYQQNNEKLIATKVFPFETNSKGYKLSLSTKDRNNEKYLEIQATDNNTNVTYILPIEVKVEKDSEYNAEINIDKIYIGGQISYSYLNGLEYADIAIDSRTTFKNSITAIEKEKKIPLFKTPVPLGNGLVGVDVQLYLVLSVEGDISLEAELPLEASMRYEKSKGLKNYKRNISFENPKIEANCDAGVMLRFEPTLIVLGCLKVVDTEADIGITASANATARPSSQICLDISISFPIIAISVCGDDEMDTIIGNLGLSAEWEIISSDNAPFQFGLHYEILPDKRMQFVEKCTYNESTKKEENIKRSSPINTYHTRYGEITQTNSPVFSFNYPDNWIISKEEVNGNSTIFEEYAEEVVELTNERNVKVTFIKFDSSLFEAGGHGHFYVEYTATKVTDPVPILPADPSNYVVVKLTEVGATVADMDPNLELSDNEYVSYALMRENIIDRYEGSLSSMGALAGYYDMISFDYPTPYAFFAESPDKQFTKEEEKEVIEILSSFRIE